MSHAASANGATPRPSGPAIRWAQALRARSHSVRFVVTLWHTLTLGVILAAFSAVLYATVSASLTRDINRSLMLIGQGTADTLFAFWKAERAATSVPGNWQGAAPATFEGFIGAGGFPDLVARWTEKTHALGRERPIRVLSRKGDVIAASEAFRGLVLPVGDTALAGSRDGRLPYETLRAASGARVRVLTLPIHERGQPLYHLQVASSLEHADASLARLRTWLLLLVPLVLTVTSVVGWWLASHALRPVGRMIRQVQGLSAGRLDARLDVPDTGDELQRLGRTFNDLLDRIEGAFRRVRQFSAAASHELRTPLTVMKGELEVALRRSRSSEEYREVLAAQLSALNDMVVTVQELLTLAREEAALGSIDTQWVDCRQLVRDTGRAWQRLSRDKRLQVEEGAQEPLWILGEPHLLERLLANLLDNALRHTPPSGQVSVSATRRDGQAHIVVQDTGPGIPAEELPHIFDRFFKPRVTLEDGHSTGLGLGLCRWIADAHSGRVVVDSHLGEGTTVTVEFPLAATR